MSKFLASVNSLHEAQLMLNTTVDIIDLKQPQHGALGALPLKDIREIVAAVNKQKKLSATIGDLPMQTDLVFNAVQNMTTSGVDYIKIGFFPNGDWEAVVNALSEIAQQHALIAVLFADTQPNLDIISTLNNAKFSGVMLDTMNKSTGSLTQVMSFDNIATFTNGAKQAGLLCGLAGSLKAEDIPQLLPLQADYLGFRGALCQQHQRTAELDIKAIEIVQVYF